MTKPAPIKTSELAPYQNLDLHELEAKIKALTKSPPSPEIKAALRAVRQVLRQRQRRIKHLVMSFEQHNDHHLLLFDSTDNFAKIAGRSVLFYTLTIADRVHRRYSVKNDSDDYDRSEDGIVSIRARAQLELQLAEIGILPDKVLSTSELHFYQLSRVYTDEQIAKLRDQSKQDSERIASLILPHSPLPTLYNLIREANRLVYYHCKRVSDTLARTTVLSQVVLDAHEMLIAYLNFANAKPHSGLVRQQFRAAPTAVFPTGATPPTSIQAQNLLNILLNARDLRNCVANIENLHLLHHRELTEILEKIVEIEQITAREYAKQRQRDRQTSQKNSEKPL